MIMNSDLVFDGIVILDYFLDNFITISYYHNGLIEGEKIKITI